MGTRHVGRSLPGHIATALAVVATTALTVAGAGSMFYEGWGQPPLQVLAYLLPGAGCLAICLAAARWPRGGGLVLLAAGLVFAFVWLLGQRGRGVPPLMLAVTLATMVGPVVLAGLLFLLEARHQRLLRAEAVTAPSPWIAGSYRSRLIAGVPLLALAVVSAQNVPGLLARRDDRLRGAREVEGNGVALVWAPRGPGWNWKRPDRSPLSWNEIALYGAASAGLPANNGPDGRSAGREDMERTCLCSHLSEDGGELLTDAPRIWRMPTADEIVRSLTRDGENAGCTWDGKGWHARCGRPPDKETPLWAPDERPIYYWAAEDRGPADALGVNYTAGITPQPKASRGPGFRCVKDVPTPRPRAGRRRSRRRGPARLARRAAPAPCRE
jgi:hypothetical protein